MGDNSSTLPLFAALRKLQLLEEAEHEPFFVAVAEQLSRSTPLVELEARFQLGFSEPNSEAAALHLAVTAVLYRIAARPYAEGGRASLAADLTAAGLSSAAANWICGAAEAAALPRAIEIRKAQAHAAAALSHSYLEDFDWQLQYVLSSNEMARVREPLLTLHLQSGAAGGGSGGGSGGVRSIELNLEQLDSVLENLSQASEALRALPTPAEAA